MNIQFCDLKAQLDSFNGEMEKAVIDVIKSTSFIKGPAVGKLEEELGSFLGGETEAITCASGTDALLLALMALDVKPGDEVIVPDFTFIATGEVVSFLGAVPVFCDVDSESFNMDPGLIEDLITEKTVGIIPVSIFGQCPDFDAIIQVAEKNSLWVLEDGAQSFGAEYKGKKSCSITEIAATSFFPAKPLGCYGDGGAVFTKNPDLAAKIRMILNHGQRERYKHSVIGINGRLDTIQAAILSVKLKTFENELTKRQKISEIYSELLNGVVMTPVISDYNSSAWAQYTVRSENRDSIRNYLSEKDIPTAVHYPIPLHKQEAFAYLRNKNLNCPVSAKLSQKVFSLPMHPFLKEEEIVYITDKIKEVAENER